MTKKATEVKTEATTKGIEKVASKGDAISLTVSDEIKESLKKVNTEAKIAQSAKKASSIWNLEKIRNSKRFIDVQHSSDSTVRNAIRKVQERTCDAINHNAKNGHMDVLLSDLKELKEINSFLNDQNVFANKKRSNYADLKTAYSVFFDNADKF